MRFCIGDEVKILSVKCHNLHFGNIEKVTSFLKKRGLVLEMDFCKRLKKRTYFIEFDSDLEKRWWFVEDELYLV